MRVFENARQFNVHRADFVDVRGNQNNYHHDQSLHVGGQNNNATYHNGPVHQGDYVNISGNTGTIGGIATGTGNKIGLQAPQIPHSNATSPAPIQGNRGNVNPAGGNQDYYSDTYHRGDHVDLSNNTGFIGGIATGQGHYIYPLVPQSYGTSLKPPAFEDTHVPQRDQSRPRQPEANSEPAVGTTPDIQGARSTHQQPQPQSQSPTPSRQVDDHTAAQNHVSLGATDPLLSPNAASSTGPISGATLTSNPQIAQTIFAPAPPSCTSTPVPTGASPAINESTAPEQHTADIPVIPGFSNLQLTAGTLVSTDQENAKDGLKVKKITFFLKLLLRIRKSQKKKVAPGPCRCTLH